jgi:hypothetical protein
MFSAARGVGLISISGNYKPFEINLFLLRVPGIDEQSGWETEGGYISKVVVAIAATVTSASHDDFIATSKDESTAVSSLQLN